MDKQPYKPGLEIRILNLYVWKRSNFHISSEKKNQTFNLVTWIWMYEPDFWSMYSSKSWTEIQVVFPLNPHVSPMVRVIVGAKGQGSLLLSLPLPMGQFISSLCPLGGSHSYMCLLRIHEVKCLESLGWKVLKTLLEMQIITVSRTGAASSKIQFDQFSSHRAIKCYTTSKSIGLLWVAQSPLFVAS